MASYSEIESEVTYGILSHILTISPGRCVTVVSLINIIMGCYPENSMHGLLGQVEKEACQLALKSL